MTDFIITFRETLEAALVVGIVLSYLSQLGNKSWFKTVYYAVFSGLAASVVAGFIFERFLGGFQGFAEELYEGIIMLVAAALISWMILWMLRQRNLIAQHLKKKVDEHVASGRQAGIFFLVFVSVLREGIETVLFLKASSIQSGGNSIFAAVGGIIVAILLGYLLFSGLKKIPLRHFFNVTSILLILFAAGLVAHGVHELQEAGVLPFLTQQVWDLNPAVVVEGEYPLLHENGAIGGILKGVFGWNGNPGALEVISYGVYLLSIFAVTRLYGQKI